MESSEQTGAYIYPLICTNRLIFGKGAFLMLFLWILGLQPRDKAAMLGVKTKEYFLEEFTWK